MGQRSSLSRPRCIATRVGPNAFPATFLDQGPQPPPGFLAECCAACAAFRRNLRQAVLVIRAPVSTNTGATSMACCEERPADRAMGVWSSRSQTRYRRPLRAQTSPAGNPTRRRPREQVMFCATLGVGRTRLVFGQFWTGFGPHSPISTICLAEFGQTLSDF